MIRLSRLGRAGSCTAGAAPQRTSREIAKHFARSRVLFSLVRLDDHSVTPLALQAAAVAAPTQEGRLHCICRVATGRGSVRLHFRQGLAPEFGLIWALIKLKV